MFAPIRLVRGRILEQPGAESHRFATGCISGGHTTTWQSAGREFDSRERTRTRRHLRNFTELSAWRSETTP
jgi:hypothetical protein